jgi:hypothetical protein
MRFTRTIQTDSPELLRDLQPGQWIDYQGTQGRYCGIRHGCVWIAWEGTARNRFARFVSAFKLGTV